MKSRIECFKVIGADFSSVQEYLGSFPTRNEVDWAALYLQLNEAHALGTLGYRYDQGFNQASLMRLELAVEQLKLVKLEHEWMASEEISGEEKARRVKEELNLRQSEPLMKQLGDRHIILLCKETSNEWELVVPLQLVTPALFVEETLLQSFKPNEFGATGMRKIEPDGDWERFTDQDVSMMPNAPPAFI